MQKLKLNLNLLKKFQNKKQNKIQLKYNQVEIYGKIYY